MQKINLFFSAALLTLFPFLPARSFSPTDSTALQWANQGKALNLDAQPDEPQEENGKNSLFKGSWALQFQINNNFSLSSFQGSTISAKRHFSNKNAIRFGLSLGGSVSDQDESSQSGARRESTGNRQFLGVNTQYTIYPAPDKSAGLLYGVGPFVRLSRGRATTTTTPDNFSGSRNKRDDTTWSTGITGLVGVEWFATRSISFVAEYASSLEYSSSSIKETAEQKVDTGNFVITNETQRDTKGFQLNSESLKFGLSVYF